LDLLQLGSDLNGSNPGQDRIKEVKEDQAEILVIMKSSGRMGLLGRHVFEQGPERFKILEASEGVFIDGRLH
jgi:hypothetical protein